MRMSEKNTNIEAHKQDETTGYSKRKLRILGLSNPEKWIQQAKQALTSQNSLYHSIRVAKKDVCDILWNIDNPYRAGFEQPVMLIRQDEETDKMMKDQGIRCSRNTGLFNRSVWWYSFSHKFVSLTWLPQSLATVHIGGKAIDSSISELWVKWFRTLEKALWTLYTYTNHDYTMHRNGLAIRDDIWVNNIISNRVNLSFWKAGKQEIASALFHRDMIDEAQERGMKIYESIEKQAMLALTQIDKIQDDQLKRYWLMVVKYPLFSLVDPTTPEDDTDSSSSQQIVNRLRQAFPSLNLISTQWGKEVHRKTLDIKINYYFRPQYQDISVRDLRQIFMKWLRNHDHKTERILVSRLAELWWYPKSINSWLGIGLAAECRWMWISEDSTEEYVEDYKKYKDMETKLKNIRRQVGEYMRGHAGEYIRRIYNVCQRLILKGFHFEGFDDIPWWEILKPFYIGMLQHIKNIDLMSSWLGELCEIEDIINEAIKLWYDTSMIQQDFHSIINEKILQELRKYEEHWDAEYLELLIQQYKKRNETKKWEKHNLEEFENYGKELWVYKRDIVVCIQDIKYLREISDLPRYIQDIVENIRCIENRGGVYYFFDIKNIVEVFDPSDIDLDKLGDICQREKISERWRELVRAILCYASNQLGRDVAHFWKYTNIFTSKSCSKAS